ncbi:hypothetical protein [Clavibacter capsici]|uniref:hypothetical protein n=1 Tax=Clavibacter capsici TaxID=1874630 RepID=UPI001FCEA5ED|nr:hypothetical protein [Clavibacter capsici]
MAGLTVVLAGCLLAGCTASPPADPEPTSTPSLTQEQQDDQTFEGLLSGFLALPFQGESTEGLRPFLTGDALSDEEREVVQYQSAHETVDGKDTYYGFRVTDRGAGYMVAQVCLDISGTRVLDAQGKDVTPQRSPAVSLQLKAVDIDGNGSWRISDLVPNDKVHACG